MTEAKLQAMAEAFCEEYLLTWTEHGRNFTDWQDEVIFADADRINSEGAVSLFYPREEDHLLIVTVFHDRSWIVQQEPQDEEPPALGSGEDGHRILDLIHWTLEAELDSQNHPKPTQTGGAMPHVLGDHNRPIVELYAAEFETEDGPLILECWSMEPSDAALAFKRFFEDDHPDRRNLTDPSQLGEADAFSHEWLAKKGWWTNKTIWTGNYIEMELIPGTRIKIGETIIELNRHSFLSWSSAYPSKMERLNDTDRLSLRNHAR